MIKEEFKSKKKGEYVYAIDNLHFKKFYGECRNVLLLYNIHLIERHFPGQRFPFDLYQSPDNEWSIEHIHPQNPSKVKSKEDALEWLGDYKMRLQEEDEESIEDREKHLDDIINRLKVQTSDSITIKMAEEIKEFSETANEALGLHQIGNQALLDKRTNSKIGNKSFLRKRNLIIEAADENSTYIPLGTLQNFLKKTTKSGKDHNLILSYWSSQDIEDYTSDIQKILVNYLPLTSN